MEEKNPWGIIMWYLSLFTIIKKPFEKLRKKCINYMNLFLEIIFMFKKKRKFQLVRIGRKRSKKKKGKKINFLLVFTIFMILVMIPVGIFI